MGCDDIKFAGPSNARLGDYHYFRPAVDVPPPSSRTLISSTLPAPAGDVLMSQSGSNTETGDTTLSDKPTASGELVSIASKSDPDDPTYLVYYGDPPTSIRELCKRYCYTRTWVPERAVEESAQINTLSNKAMPYYTGYDPFGVDVPTFGSPVTVGPTAFSSWFTPMYAGQRGAFRKKYLFSGTSNQSPVVSRDRYVLSAGIFTSTSQLLSQSSALISKWLSCNFAPISGGGATSTNLDINNSIEVEFPFYWARRFSAARTINAPALQCNNHRVSTTSFNPNVPGPPREDFDVVYQQYDAVGEDWSLFFFTGVPIMYQYDLCEDL